MQYLIGAFVFLFGLIIGSFLNVVIYRYNTGRGIHGRSGCMNCGKTLRWFELIPVASFFVQRGKCRTCKSKLSMQYPFVELVTGMLFVGTLAALGLPDGWREWCVLILALVAWCLLVVIVVYDSRHKIIPDSFAYSFAALGLIRIVLESQPATSSLALSLLAGPILFLPFFLLWILSRGRWIGLGDGKLALGIGWMLGLGLGLSAVVLAFWIGAIVSVAMMVIARLNSNAKALTMKSEIPFAPFLILGYTIVYFSALDVIGLQSLINTFL